jgi:hypothetical protein
MQENFPATSPCMDRPLRKDNLSARVESTLQASQWYTLPQREGYTLLFLHHPPKKCAQEPIICMGGSFLALYSPRPGACTAETCVAEAETCFVITGEEPALAVAAVSMIRDGKWQSEPIPSAGAGIRGVKAGIWNAEIWGATVQIAEDRFPLRIVSGQEAGKPSTAVPIRPRARIRAARIEVAPIRVARGRARWNHPCRAGFRIRPAVTGDALSP